MALLTAELCSCSQCKNPTTHNKTTSIYPSLFYSVSLLNSVYFLESFPIGLAYWLCFTLVSISRTGHVPTMRLYSVLRLELGILDPHPLLLTSSASQAMHVATEPARPENSYLHLQRAHLHHSSCLFFLHNMNWSTSV